MFGRGPAKLLAAVACLLCCAALAPAVAAADEPGGISGTVIEAGGGPIEGLEVQAYGLHEEGSGSALTDGSGEYEIDNLPAGEYEVDFTGRVCAAGDCAPKYAERFWEDVKPFDPPTPVVVAAEATTPGIDAELELNGAIKGTLTDSLGPIAYSLVCVNAQSEYHPACVFSNANGEYDVPDLPPGPFNIEFSGRVCTTGSSCESEACELGQVCTKPYVSKFWEDAPNDESATLVTVLAGQTVENIDPTLVKGGQIKGKVTVAALGSPPLAGFEACAESNVATGACAKTDAGGEYTIEGLGEANNWLVVFHEACPESGCLNTYETQYFDGKIEEGEADQFALNPGDVKTGIDASITELIPRTPAFTSQPTLSGTPAVGSTLSCSEGVVENYPTSISYAWLRDGTAIAGQAGSAYDVTNEDEGARLTCEVTVANGAGSASVGSNGLTVPKHEEEARHEEEKSGRPTDTGGSSSGSSKTTTTTVVVPAPVPPPGTASAGSGKATTGRSVSITLTCSGQAACQGSLKLTYKQKGKQVVIGKASFNIAVGKSQTIAVKLTAKGESLVKKAGKKGLKVKLTGNAVKARTLTVH
jgi:hypothetical protein